MLKEKHSALGMRAGGGGERERERKRERERETPGKVIYVSVSRAPEVTRVPRQSQEDLDLLALQDPWWVFQSNPALNSLKYKLIVLKTTKPCHLPTGSCGLFRQTRNQGNLSLSSSCWMCNSHFFNLCKDNLPRGQSSPFYCPSDPLLVPGWLIQYCFKLLIVFFLTQERLSRTGLYFSHVNIFIGPFKKKSGCVHLFVIITKPF